MYLLSVRRRFRMVIIIASVIFMICAVLITRDEEKEYSPEEFEITDNRRFSENADRYHIGSESHHALTETNENHDRRDRNENKKKLTGMEDSNKLFSEDDDDFDDKQSVKRGTKTHLKDDQVVSKSSAKVTKKIQWPIVNKKPDKVSEEVAKYTHFMEVPRIPNTFFYVWCGNRTVLFKQYLSILSVIRHMRPDNIVFYYDIFPEEHDRQKREEYHYNTWFAELQQYYPFINAEQLTPDQNRAACDSVTLQPREKYILHILSEFGGIYVSENIMITRTLDLDVDYYFRWDTKNQEGLLMAPPNITRELTIREITTNKKYQNNKCVNITLEYTYDRIGDDDYTTCLKIIGKEFSFDIWSLNGTIYPRDFWDRPDSLGRVVRYVMYGSSEIRLPKKNAEIVVPNIGHMVWVGGGEMDFLFYLGVLSMVYIQKVEKLYIHGDQPPTGPRWEKVKTNPIIIFRYRHFEGKQVFGHKIGNKNPKINERMQWWFRAHWSDIIRVDTLVRWGGIYMDTDAIITRKLDDELRKYDAVSHLSMASRPPYPDSFSNGFLLARPGAPFFRLFQESMRDYQDYTWLYSGLLVPYKIIERYPWIIKLESHLEVVCLKTLCHPTWVPDFKNMSMHHLNSDSIKDWRTDSHAYHFCSNHTPLELDSEESLLSDKDNSIFAQMGEHVLRMAGLLQK